MTTYYVNRVMLTCVTAMCATKYARNFNSGFKMLLSAFFQVLKNMSFLCKVPILTIAVNVYAPINPYKFYAAELLFSRFPLLRASDGFNVQCICASIKAPNRHFGIYCLCTFIFYIPHSFASADTSFILPRSRRTSLTAFRQKKKQHVPYSVPLSINLNVPCYGT